MSLNVQGLLSPTKEQPPKFISVQPTGKERGRILGTAEHKPQAVEGLAAGGAAPTPPTAIGDGCSGLAGDSAAHERTKQRPRRSRRLSGLQPDATCAATDPTTASPRAFTGRRSGLHGNQQQQQQQQQQRQQQQQQRQLSEPLMDLEDAGLVLDRCVSPSGCTAADVDADASSNDRQPLDFACLVGSSLTSSVLSRLSRYRRRGLAVTDVTSAEWCQQQLAYTLSAKIKKVPAAPHVTSQGSLHSLLS